MLRHRKVALIGAILIASPCFALCASQSQPTYNPSANKADKEATKSSPDETFRQWVTHDAAGFFTLVLCVVGVAQIALFYWQLRLIRESLVDAKTAADAAKDGAKAAQASADLAREEFNATHRPKLRVRGIRPHLSPLAIHYLIVNIGETRATIKQHDITLFVDPNGDLVNATQHPAPMERRELEPGEAAIFTSERLVYNTESAEFDDAWQQAHNEGTLKIRGFIEYADARGVLRRTGFLRTYDSKSNRYIPDGGPEDEYED